MIRFLRQFFLFGAVMGVLLYALHLLYGPAVIHRYTGLLFGFMAGLTFLIYSLTARLVAVSPTNLGIGYLIGMTVRMLTSLALVTVHLARGAPRKGAASGPSLAPSSCCTFRGLGLKSGLFLVTCGRFRKSKWRKHSALAGNLQLIPFE
ncbi:hypothetical protein [Hymenobacter glacialis]|uniref:Uncharacterized protein n=1 Tax=Hymenobacter glacialis TaxID=1908236 RepID=A0A1G1T3S4_9BACT|nr:hypothetical protein [Hymenobacter glacialis]OGX85514.1 hypothetical protein BEN48_01350 [Hymenobacter glacialis]